jgi:hypothetical protein
VKFLDTDHPFFKPLWIRVLIVLLTGGWAIFEFLGGSPFWGVIFLGFCALSVWGFFVDFNPRDTAEPVKPAPREGKDR